MVINEDKRIKNHNKDVVDAALYYRKNKTKENLEKIDKKTSKVLTEGINYLKGKENVSEKEAEYIFERIARKGGK